MPRDFGLIIIGAVIGLPVGLVLISFVNAIWLRLAANILKMPHIPYLTAFKSSLISNFTVAMLNISVGLGYGMGMAGMQGRFNPSGRDYFPLVFTPTFHLMAMTLALVVTAVIYMRTLAKKEERLEFTDALALTAIYQALMIGFLFFAVGMIYSMFAVAMIIEGGSRF
jgi:hypothetical protein